MEIRENKKQATEELGDRIGHLDAILPFLEE